MNSTTSLRLLLVDDDPYQVDYIAYLLRQSLPTNVEMITMSDPQAALEYLRSTMIDLLVTDLDMPQVRGLDLLQAARQRSPAVQAFVLTAASTWDELIRALDLGATDYLLKPVDPALLVDLIAGSVERIVRWRAALAGTFELKRKRAEASEATR